MKERFDKGRLEDSLVSPMTSELAEETRAKKDS